jgi:hypothetical protein
MTNEREAFVAEHGGKLARILGIDDWFDVADRDAKVDAALARIFSPLVSSELLGPEYYANPDPLAGMR